MKKASDILFLIGFIFGIIGAVFTLVLAIVLLVASGNEELILQGLKDGSIHTSYVGTAEEQAKVVCALIRGLGIGCIFATLFDVAVCVVTWLARKKMTMGFLVAALVLAILSGNVLILVGSILGLVAISQEPKQVE